MFAELASPHKPDAVHPFPIQLEVHHYEDLGPFLFISSTAGLCTVGLDTEKDQAYVIGVIVAGKLFPFMTPRAHLNNNYGRIKIRIHGNNADEIVSISKEDPLNSRFGKKFGPENIRSAEIS